MSCAHTYLHGCFFSIHLHLRLKQVACESWRTQVVFRKSCPSPSALSGISSWVFWPLQIPPKLFQSCVELNCSTTLLCKCWACRDPCAPVKGLALISCGWLRKPHPHSWGSAGETLLTRGGWDQGRHLPQHHPAVHSGLHWLTSHRRVSRDAEFGLSPHSLLRHLRKMGLAGLKLCFVCVHLSLHHADRWAKKNCAGFLYVFLIFSLPPPPTLFCPLGLSRNKKESMQLFHCPWTTYSKQLSSMPFIKWKDYSLVFSDPQLWNSKKRTCCL